MSHYTVSYAQNREDIIIGAFFPDIENGFYVDVGANDPIEDSVTKHFYDQGWRGINIEPSPRYFNILRKARPKDINLPVGVSDKKTTLLLREYRERGLATFSKDMVRAHEKSQDASAGQEQEVEVTTLADIFEAHKATGDIHFLKIDVEGLEYEVLAGNNWDKFRPILLCIEANHVFKDWRPLLKKVGYKKVFFDGLNEYYLANEQSEREALFNYPKALIGKLVVPFAAIKDLERQERKIQARQQTIERQKTALQVLRFENRYLKTDIRNHKRIRHQVKMLLQSLDAAFIDMISSIKRQKYPKGLTNEKVAHTTEAQKLLELAHTYDRQAFHRVGMLARAAYSSLMFLYKTVRKILRIIITTPVILVKRVKRAF